MNTRIKTKISEVSERSRTFETTETSINKKEGFSKRSTFALIFYLKAVKKTGFCPIMGRVSIDAKLAQFTTKLEIKPKLWNSKTSRAMGKSQESILINKALDKLSLEVNMYYKELIGKQGYVTAELVKNALLGITKKKDQLLALFDEHNQEFKLRVGVNRAKATYNLYVLSRKHLACFIKQKYGIDDIPLLRLDHAFIDAYDFYLRVDKRMKPNSVLGHIIPLQKMVRRAISQGILKRDPFFSYTAEKPLKQRRHLTADEFYKLLTTPIESKHIAFTRDLFVFSCFCGLSYVDVCNLTQRELITQADGSLWIETRRQKTGAACSIKLLDIAIQIIDKYKTESIIGRTRKGERSEKDKRNGVSIQKPNEKSTRIFRVWSLSAIDRHLKIIAKCCGIEQNLSFHMSRHTYATQVCLSGGVPMETLSKMMGHRNIQTTQIYAKITNKKVEEDMNVLKNRIVDKYSIFEDKKMPVGIKLNQNFNLLED